MERNVSLEEISDGKLYNSNDMVKADCQDCKGCSACCRGMGNSITLDPWDVFEISTNLQKTFEQLLEEAFSLHMEKGVILPNIKMDGKEEKCFFLDEEGRCTVHDFRPGICRLFPLGRHYENHAFQYFLQIHECKNINRSKVKVRKWIGIANLQQYEEFVLDWHYFIKEIQDMIEKVTNQEQIKEINLSILNLFYQTPYDAREDFYKQFYERLKKIRVK